jgi:two-component system OmpR family sensor kinase
MPLGFKMRLSLWHAVAVALILALAAFGADWALARLVRGQVDDALLALASSEAAAVLGEGGKPIRIHEAPSGTAPPSFPRLDKFVQIIDQSGEKIARSATLGTARLPASPPLLEALRRGETAFQTVEDFGEEPIRMVSLPLDVGGIRYAVQVATSLDDARAVLRAARWLFLVISLGILSAVVATGALLARRALRPIDDVVRRARGIGEMNLAERLPHPGSQDEVGRLVETLNEMLARIERGVEAQRRFAADAAHELRSPLSRLRAELEVSRMHAEAERRHVKVFVRPGGDLSVNVTPGAASLALANVLDNAVKFSPAGGRVTVEVLAEDGEAVVAVSDTGPGLLVEEIPRLFERFRRGSASRSADTPGVGLGLAISRALIERQGGSIAAENVVGGGAVFSIRLPLG